MSLRNLLNEKLILPISDLLKGEHTYRGLKMLQKAESWNDEQLRNFQNGRLRTIIDEAAKHVPYYREWFRQNHLSANDIQSIDDLAKLPIVNKALMRKEGIERFTNAGFPPSKRINSRSSGSTGEPFSFYVSKEAYSVNTAAKLRSWYLAGYRLGDRYMKIANGARHGKMKKLQDRINNCIYIPFYSIDDNALKNILDKIETSRPAIIRSYPIPLYLLAQYRNHHSEYSHKPNHVMTTGSTLPQTYRDEIEKAFGCDVIDSYSCEGTADCYETSLHDGYHVCGFYGVIEVLDNEGNPVTNGIGRVVSTDLWNLAHPFIRYDTQDLVEVKDGKIIRIMGRECDALVPAHGSIYTVHNFSHFFTHEVPGITAYQIIKQKNNSITFRLVVTEQYNKSVEQYIKEHWQLQLNMTIDIVIVDEIPLMRNNKRLTIIEE